MFFSLKFEIFSVLVHLRSLTLLQMYVGYVYTVHKT